MPTGRGPDLRVVLVRIIVAVVVTATVVYVLLLLQLHRWEADREKKRPPAPTRLVPAGSVLPRYG
jgi:hypothetical protein